MEERYYYTKEGEKYGPYSLSELINEGISNETLIWYHGLKDWTPAKDIEIVYNALEEASIPPLPINMADDAEVPPPLHIEETKPEDISDKAANQSAEVDKTDSDSSQTKTETLHKAENNTSIESDKSFLHRHIVGILTTISVVVLLFVMALTCPSENDHKIVISNLASDVASDFLADETGSELAGLGASLLLPDLTEKLFSQFFKVHNCGLFSYCEYDFNGNKKLVSIGAFGHVFTTNSDQVRKMLRESRHRR